MFSADKGGKHRRRVRIAVPAVTVALAVGVASAFLLAPAQAGEPLPAPSTTPRIGSPTQAQLTARVKDAVAADAASASVPSQDKLSASPTTPTDTASPTTPQDTLEPQPQIIGGTDTTITTAPWMVQLWYYDDKGTADTADDDSFFCGGTVVSPSKVLTAAHCASGYNWKNNGAIITGTSQLPTTDDAGNTDFHGGTIVGVWRQWVNPAYKSATIDNDIAILTLAAPVKAKPLPVTKSADTASYQAGTQAKVYGWGRTSSTNQDLSESLRTATLPVNSDATCAGAYGTAFIKGHMVCAGTPASGSDTGTVSACNGDSGGPLVVGGKLVGIVSWGVQDCVFSGSYSVFTKVSTYVGQVNMRVDDANLNSDYRADLFARTSGGTGYEYNSNTTNGFAARQSWGNWSGLNIILQTDLNRDDYQDFVVRTTGGIVYWKHFDPAAGQWINTQLFSNWKTAAAIVTPGDVTGDANPDLLAADAAGVLYLYPGKGNGTFGARSTIGSGWSQYNALLGHGDFNADGYADLIARGKNNVVYLYKGRGSVTAPFAARVQVRTGWTYTKSVTTGDMTNDGIADLVARDSSGVLWLYKGTGKATNEIWASRIRVGSGWNQYNVFG